MYTSIRNSIFGRKILTLFKNRYEEDESMFKELGKNLKTKS